MAERYENLKNIKDEQFRRLTGAKHHTFNRMLEILQEAFRKKMALGGRRPQLSLADMMLRQHRWCIWLIGHGINR